LNKSSDAIVEGKVGVPQQSKTLIEELTSAFGCGNTESLVSESTELLESELIQENSTPIVTFKLADKKKENNKGIKLKTKRKLHEIDHTMATSPKESIKSKKHNLSKEYKACSSYYVEKVKGNDFDKHIAVFLKEVGEW